MSIRTALPGAIGLSLLAMSSQALAQSQDTAIDTITATDEMASFEIEAIESEAAELANFDTEISSITFDEPNNEITVDSWAQQQDFSTSSSLLATNEPVAETLLPAESAPLTIESTEAADLHYNTSPETVEIAQSRRRTRGRVGSSNYVGIGADFGYADDVSFAVISKFGLSNRLSIRPSALIGDDISVLVPVTYDFNQGFGSNDGGFQVKPYIGGGVAYSSDDDDDDSEIQFLVSGGADFPISRQFTLNAQANWSVFDDSDFGVTVGVGYNFGNAMR